MENPILVSMAAMYTADVDVSSVVESGSAAVVNLVLLAFVLAGLIAALVWLFVTVQRRRRVSAASLALTKLHELNAEYGTLVQVLPPIRLEFGARVNSKAKFDRFDLEALMSGSVLENELWVDQEVRLRLAATGQFEYYHYHYESIADESLGKSNHPRVRDDRFAAIEQKLFIRRKLVYPRPTARVRATVRYTSPKGQNSYARPLEWDFEQLQQGLTLAQVARARQSSAEALRARERSLMTPGLRMDILRRDGFRCRMCGATSADGATLHVDHVLPVSHGGQTVPHNLQALCAICNIGKSNKFVG